MEYSLHVVLDVFSFLILAIILSISLLNKNRIKHAEKVFMMMEIAMMALLVSDGTTFALMGHIWAIPLIHVLWGSTYILTTAAIVLFHFYACSFLSEYKKVEVNTHRNYYFVVAVIINLIWLIALPFDLFMDFDPNGCYRYTSVHIFSQLIYGFLLIPDFLMVYRNRKVLGSKRWSWVIFLSVPVITRVFDLYSNFAMLFPMMTLSVVFIYDNLNQETDMALMEQTIAIQKQEQELQDTREKIVLSQIQPHFLYNVLNTICILCRRNPDLAAKTTADFATYLRMNLDFLSVDTPVLFDEEQRHTEIYLSLEQLRFGDTLRVVWDIQTRSFALPVLTLQPIVENAVKHGICQKDNGGTVWISTKKEEDAYVLIVKDDGVGFDPTSITYDDNKPHIGMANTKRRLSVISNATMTVESTVGEGTTVTIRIPKGGKA